MTQLCTLAEAEKIVKHLNSIPEIVTISGGALKPYIPDDFLGGQKPPSEDEEHFYHFKYKNTLKTIAFNAALFYHEFFVSGHTPYYSMQSTINEIKMFLRR